MSSKWGSIFRMLNIFRSKDPQFEFLLGKDYLAQGNYKKALFHFKTACQYYKDDNSRIKSLENAIIAASRLKNPQEVFNLSYQLSKLVARTSRSDVSRLLPYLEQSWHAALLLKDDNLSLEKLGEVTVLTFLAYLASMKYEDCRKVLQKARSYLPSTDLHLSYMEEALKILSSDESFIKDWRFPSLSVPKEFSILMERAEAVARSHANLKMAMEVKPASIDVNGEATVFITLRAQAPMTITQLDLEHLPRGLRMTSSNVPTLPLQLKAGESVTIEYLVRAQLDGKWKIGPMKVNYKVIDESKTSGRKFGVEFTVKSDDVELLVHAPEAVVDLQVKLFMRKEINEEDQVARQKMELACTVANPGEQMIENLLLSVTYPKELELVEGTNNKRILELATSEEYEFSLVLKPKDDQSLQSLVGKEITVSATAGDDEIGRKTIILSEDLLFLSDDSD